MQRVAKGRLCAPRSPGWTCSLSALRMENLQSHNAMFSVGLPSLQRCGRTAAGCGERGRGSTGHAPQPRSDLCRGLEGRAAATTRGRDGWEGGSRPPPLHCWLSVAHLCTKSPLTLSLQRTARAEQHHVPERRGDMRARLPPLDRASRQTKKGFAASALSLPLPLPMPRCSTLSYPCAAE